MFRLVTETTVEKSDKSSSPERPVKNISKKVAKKVESKIKKVEFTTGDEDTVVVTAEKVNFIINSILPKDYDENWSSQGENTHAYKQTSMVLII